MCQRRRLGVRGLDLSLELQRGTSLGHPPAGSAQASGEMVSHGQQESGERVAGGALCLHI